MTQDQIAVFQTVAGTTPDQISLLLRTTIGSILFAWAAWMCVTFISHLRSEHGCIGDVLGRMFRVGCVLMVGLILITYK